MSFEDHYAHLLMQLSACRLVGVARLAPVDDVLLDRFLGLPTDCKAVMSSQFLFPPDMN